MVRLIGCSIFFIILLSCGKKIERESTVLLRYEDKELTQEEVIAMIPNGINPEDSVSLFKSIVETWMRNQVLAKFAEEQLYDLIEIDHKVNEYRNNLIVLEYIKKMRQSHHNHIEEDKIEEYYSNYQKELKLEVPLIKGVFIKIATENSAKEKIKELLVKEDSGNIDILEQNYLDNAIEYNYFRDKWVDWETISEMIPFRFGDPDKFVETHKYFETDYADCTYILQITDYLKSGEEQPYEFAKNWIEEILTQADLSKYEKDLVNSLINKAIKENKLEIIGMTFPNLKTPLKNDSILQKN